MKAFMVKHRSALIILGVVFALVLTGWNIERQRIYMPGEGEILSAKLRSSSTRYGPMRCKVHIAYDSRTQLTAYADRSGQTIDRAIEALDSYRRLNNSEDFDRIRQRLQSPHLGQSAFLQTHALTYPREMCGRFKVGQWIAIEIAVDKYVPARPLRDE